MPRRRSGTIDLGQAPMSALVASAGSYEDERAADELILLLSNLGVGVTGRVVQRRNAPDPATFIGRGKALEIGDFARRSGAGMLVVDGALTPTQRSNLKKISGLEVWDRTFTIMKVFERRANTAEAKLQVELAMLRYEIPSLKGLGHQMSRLGGGIGTRGPGETEFERHRRKLERRIKQIERQLEGVRGRRQQRLRRRSRDGHGAVSLAGYTNSGKSSLLRALSGDFAITPEDRLFSTLDTITRRVEDSRGRGFLLSDTVGFIRMLPPELVAAFRATLEEVVNADLLLLVVDAASPEPMAGFEIVSSTLTDIGAGEIPRVVVLNKMDIAHEESMFVSAGLSSRGEEVASVSALTGQGLRELVDLTVRRLFEIKGGGSI